MEPAEIKAKIQDTYVRALESKTMWSRGSGIADLMRDLKLYGREAGTDFVKTNLDRIVNEAVSAAECRQPMLEIMMSGFGRDASEGVAQSLRDLTALRVDTDRWGIKIIWAQTNPGLISDGVSK